MTLDVSAVPPQVSQLLEAIGQDRERGAAEIARSAAEALVLFAQLSPAGEPSQLDVGLRSVLRGLIASQPAMTSLLHLAADVLPRAKAAKSAEEFRAAVQDASKEFIQRIDREALLIAYHLLAVVQGGNVVLTISRSSTLLDSFRWIHTQGRVFRVLCAESLPGGEGVRLVDELRKYEIDAELFRDDDLDWQLRRADVVLVGADTVSESGVINKKGTSRLALSARSFRIPLYVVTGSTKFFPVGLPLPTYSEELFDVTPLEDISGVICEVGCLGPARIRERLPRSEMLQELLHQA